MVPRAKEEAASGVRTFDGDRTPAVGQLIGQHSFANGDARSVTRGKHRS